MPPTFLLLSVERQFRSGVRSATYHISTVGGVVESDGTESLVSVRWRGDRLHIETSVYDSGPARDSGPHTEHNEEWGFDQDGRLRIIVTDRRSDSEVSTHTLVYRRQ